jgi:replicative DNA helicase
LRFGISSRVSRSRQKWTLDVLGVDDQRRFLQEIAVAGPVSEPEHELLNIVRSRRDRASLAALDTVGWDAPYGLGVAGVADDLIDDGALDLARAAELLASLELDLEASNDVLWDEVVGIQTDGVEEVFDTTVAGGHNFIANGIAVHNSIEQDSDVVILLHREEAYERESPRAGEADLIVAKHRNGPTDTIVLAFQGHYSRFTNMAPGF